MTKKVKKATEAITVEVLPIGNEKKEIALEEGATVQNALEAYGGIDTDTAEVRCNGEIVSFSDEVEDGDRLIVVTSGKVQGGNN